MPETYPRISMDNDGVCNYCRRFEQKWSGHNYEKKEKELKRILEKHKGGRRRYDCIVPLSGGKDSTYVLYLCKIKYNLNVLAVNFDNGFQSKQAKDNMRRSVKKLDVDFLQYRPKSSVQKELMKMFLLKTGEFCTPCNSGIRAATFRTAQKEGVKILVSGQSVKEAMPKEIYDVSQTYFRDVIKDEVPLWKVKDYLWPDYKWLFYKQIYMPYYVEWNVFEIDKILRKELGWGQLTEHADCMLSPLIDYLRRLRWGFGASTHKYGLYVREGWISREEALEKVMKEESEVEPLVLEYFLKELGLTRQDIKRSLEMSHMNYKSYNTFLLNLFRKITGSRFILKEWEL